MNFARETDSGKGFEKITEKVKDHYGEAYKKVAGDVWNILMDKAENEAHDKIKIVHEGEGVIAYGSLYR